MKEELDSAPKEAGDAKAPPASLIGEDPQTNNPLSARGWIEAAAWAVIARELIPVAPVELPVPPPVSTLAVRFGGDLPLKGRNPKRLA